MMSVVGTFATCPLNRAMSALRGNPEDICSERVLPTLTHCSHCFIQSLLRAELDGLQIAVQASPVARRCNERSALPVSAAQCPLVTTFSAGFRVRFGPLI